MSKDIIYLGDTKLDQAASYLAGIMSYRNIEFDYLDSDERFTDDLLENSYKGIIISDYPSANFSTEQLDRIFEKVKAGVGLLMIGGWDTFTGLGGGYNKTVLKDILPVTMSEMDDRMNYYAPCMIEQNISHQITNSVPFDKNPPAIAGYNLLKAKDGSEMVLSVKKYRVSKEQDFSFTCERTDPLLVLGEFGKGRIAAYAGDVAPHWAGGFVDWGDERITLQADGTREVEVGNWYITFFGNIVNWICCQV
jgi:uncharacterized membrane protein